MGRPTSPEWAAELQALETGASFSRVTDQLYSGTFKVKRKGELLPMATWIDDDTGERVMRLGTEVVEPARQIDVFNSAKSVSMNDCRHAMQYGNWPGELDGDGKLDPLDEIEELIAEARELAKAKIEQPTQAQADRARNIYDRVGQLSKPVLDAGRIEVKQRKTVADEATAQWRERRDYFKGLKEKFEPVQAACKSVYLPWQRQRDLDGLDAKCGGQFSSRHGYTRKNDDKHPATIAAKAAEEKAEADRLAAIKAESNDEARKAAALAEMERRAVESARKSQQNASGSPETSPSDVDARPCPGDTQTAPATLGIDIEDYTAAAVHFATDARVRAVLEAVAFEAVQQGARLDFVTTKTREAAQ